MFPGDICLQVENQRAIDSIILTTSVKEAAKNRETDPKTKKEVRWIKNKEIDTQSRRKKNYRLLIVLEFLIFNAQPHPCLWIPVIPICLQKINHFDQTSLYDSWNFKILNQCMIGYLYKLNENITSFFSFRQYPIYSTLQNVYAGSVYFFPSVKWKNNFVSFFILLLFFVF